MAAAEPAEVVGDGVEVVDELVVLAFAVEVECLLVALVGAVDVEDVVGEVESVDGEVDEGLELLLEEAVGGLEALEGEDEDLGGLMSDNNGAPYTL